MPHQRRGGFGKAVEPRGDAMVQRAGRVLPVRTWLAGGDAGKKFETLIDRIDRIDREGARGGRLDDVVTQHQVLDVAGRDDDALFAGEPGQAADIEEPLDLLVGPADRLDAAVLVDRAGDREV